MFWFKTVEEHKQDDTSAPKTAQEERALTRETQPATAVAANAAALAVAAGCPTAACCPRLALANTVRRGSPSSSPPVLRADIVARR